MENEEPCGWPITDCCFGEKLRLLEGRLKEALMWLEWHQNNPHKFNDNSTWFVLNTKEELEND